MKNKLILFVSVLVFFIHQLGFLPKVLLLDHHLDPFLYGLALPALNRVVLNISGTPRPRFIPETCFFFFAFWLTEWLMPLLRPAAFTFDYWDLLASFLGWLLFQILQLRVRAKSIQVH